MQVHFPAGSGWFNASDFKTTICKTFQQPSGFSIIQMPNSTSGLRHWLVYMGMNPGWWHVSWSMFLSFLAGNHGCYICTNHVESWIWSFNAKSVLPFLHPLVPANWEQMTDCIHEKTLCWLPDSLVFDCIISSLFLFLLSQPSILSYVFLLDILCWKENPAWFSFSLSSTSWSLGNKPQKWQVVWTMPLSTLRLNICHMQFVNDPQQWGCCGPPTAELELHLQGSRHFLDENPRFLVAHFGFLVLQKLLLLLVLDTLNQDIREQKSSHLH